MKNSKKGSEGSRRDLYRFMYLWLFHSYIYIYMCVCVCVCVCAFLERLYIFMCIQGISDGTYIFYICIGESAKKFKDWPRHSSGMWPDEVYFQRKTPLQSTLFFHRCYSAWIPLVKKVFRSRFNVFIWTFEPALVY